MEGGASKTTPKGYQNLSRLFSNKHSLKVHLGTTRNSIERGEGCSGPTVPEGRKHRATTRKPSEDLMDSAKVKRVCQEGDRKDWLGVFLPRPFVAKKSFRENARIC